jgi:predicted permease
MLDWKDEIRKLLAGLKLAPTREAEIVDELAQHLEDRYADLLASGATRDQASRTVLAELSESEALLKELRRVEQPVNQEPVVLGAGRPDMIADLWQDLRYSVRSMRKHAFLSTAVIVTLTLGIGISTGVFTYFNAAGLRAPVDKDFDSFVRVYSAYTKDQTRPGRPGETTLEDYLAFRDGITSLRSLAAYADFHLPMGTDAPVEVRALMVTSNFFLVYDLEQPLMGRLLEPEDFAAANPVVVFSERLWRNRFAADPQIVGKLVHFNGQPVTVVGVTPNFAGMVNSARAWFPYTLETYLKQGDNLLRPGEAPWLRVEGRLNPGSSRGDVAAELKLLATQQDRLHPGRTTTLTVTDGSAIEDPQDGANVRLGFSVLLAALLIFVLIVCVNVSTLLLSRSAARRHEIAVRIALGAGRMRLLRMLLTESFLLASVGGLVSFYLANHIPILLDHWLINRRWESAGREYSVVPDWRVFSYLVLVTVLAGTMAGLTPALQSLKVNLTEMLKGRQNMLGGVRGARLYSVLIGVQVALSFFLLYVAVLFVGTAKKAASFEPGFETRQVLSMSLLMQSRAPGQRTWGAFHRTISERLSALPGVQSVSYAGIGPFRIGAPTFDVQIPGQARRPAGINWVSPDFFTTLEIPIVSGRAFLESDPTCGNTGCAVVVSERLAREFWPSENPLGQMLQDRKGHSFEVVGVARDVSSTRLGGLDGPMIYQPFDFMRARNANAFVRFSGDGAALARVVNATIRDVAPELTFWAAPHTIESFREELMESVWSVTQLIAFICVIAVALALIGIYGVVAFAVSQRTKEMGIRLALGATKKDIYQSILGTSSRPVALGLLLGLAITVATCSAIAQLLRNQEFSFDVAEPTAYAATAVLLACVAVTAMLIPARRATKVDPMVALREE